MAEDLQTLRKTLGNCALAQYVARFDCQNRNMNEQFRTVAEVAEMLGVSKDTVRRLFANEPGVIDLGKCEATRGKRQYRVLRIPSAVVARLLEQKSVK
jgi:excisionase family DNA binding protein